MNIKPLSFTVTIVFDNICIEEGFQTDFGFSALIYSYYTQNYLLFDTGGNDKILIRNLKRAKVEITRIRKVIISHNHSDHMGGLEGIQKINPNIDIYIPNKSIPIYATQFLNLKVIDTPNIKEIEKNIYTSGQLGNVIKEQALYLKTKKNELIIIVGCAHPGLENFILKAKELGHIKAIIGGFHRFRNYHYLEDIDIIASCHCTSDLDAIRQRFPHQFKNVCVGTTLSF
jgi:7,8-dihydropterin-6-yl-methyl-4-(beta-D-ribofuranosyl)aminobenzene 5'-phosphate synthase